MSFCALPIGCLRADITYEFLGLGQATIDSDFHNNIRFEIKFSIDENEDDLNPEANRGAFANGTATLSIDSLGINDVLATNITGLLLEDFGSTRLHLIDSNSFFDGSGLTAEWGTSGIFSDVNSVNPYNEPVPTPDRFQSSLAWNLANGQEVALNTIFALRTRNGEPLVATPEPASAFMFLAVVLPLTMRRRRRRR